MLRIMSKQHRITRVVYQQLSTEVTMTREFYKYAALPASPSNSIRLLRVHQKLTDGMVSCELRITTTDAKYTCLSYTWGSEDNQQEILINGLRCPIRRNLWDFLEMARHNYSHAELWIDAVCIDQTDDAERSRQVQMMMDIYVAGQLTMVWLGEPSSADVVSRQCVSRTSTREFLTDISSWFNTFKKLLSAELAQISPATYFDEIPRVISQDGGLWDLDTHGTTYHNCLLRVAASLARDDCLSSVWFLVHSLCYHVYWTRMWIVQEIYSSQKNMELIRGNIKVGAAEFFLVLKLARQLGDIVDYDQRILSIKESTDPLMFPRAEYYTSLLGIPSCNVQQSDSQIGIGTIAGSNASEQAMLHQILVDLRFDDRSTITQLGSGWRSPRQSGQLDLHILLERYQTSQCSQINDKVFALAGLCSKTHPLKVDYSLSSCELYFRLCESRSVSRSSLMYLMRVLMLNLRIGLLDFLLLDRRTTARRLMYESVLEPGSKVDRSILLCSVRSRPSPHGTQRVKTLFICGFCENCRCLVDLEYIVTRPDINLEPDITFVQCFKRIHVGMSMEHHQKLGYRVLFFKQVHPDDTDEKYDPPPPSRQIWKSEHSWGRMSLSSVLKEASVLHKLLFEAAIWENTYRSVSVAVSTKEELLDDLIMVHSGCEAFAASKKISCETLTKLFKPDLVKQIEQHLKAETNQE